VLLYSEVLFLTYRYLEMERFRQKEINEKKKAGSSGSVHGKGGSLSEIGRRRGTSTIDGDLARDRFASASEAWLDTHFNLNDLERGKVNEQEWAEHMQIYPPFYLVFADLVYADFGTKENIILTPEQTQTVCDCWLNNPRTLTVHLPAYGFQNIVFSAKIVAERLEEFWLFDSCCRLQRLNAFNLVLNNLFARHYASTHIM
jgi:hypothetical protein